MYAFIIYVEFSLRNAGNLRIWSRFDEDPFDGMINFQMYVYAFIFGFFSLFFIKESETRNYS